MGNSPAKQALEDFSKAIRVGNVTSVDSFLARVASARGSASSGDKLTQELRTFDLNKPLPDGLTALQLAASCGRAEVVRLLLDISQRYPDLPSPDLEVCDSRKRTALHLAAGHAGPPNCTACLSSLLERQADPCMADYDGRTPLDTARLTRCSYCVRALEDKVKVWQGWTDHDEHLLLQLPNWRPRWCVVLQDRYPNTGPWREASSLNVSCYNCQTILRAPAYASRLRCSCCSVEVAVTRSLQLVLYDDITPGNFASSTPSLRLRLPTQPQHICAKALEDAGLRSFAGALMEGKLRRALQNTTGTSRAHGFTLKLLRGNGAVECEHSLRVSTPAERDFLVEVLSDPARAAHAAAVSQAQLQIHAALPAPPPSNASAGEPLPWSCPQCTYFHSGGEAAATHCSVCGCERPPEASAPELMTVAGDLPEASAPPLLEEDLPAPAPATAIATAPPAATPPQATQGARLVGAAESVVQPAPPAGPGPSPASAALPVRAPTGAGAAGAQQQEQEPQQQQQEDDSGMCAICLENPADTAVVPCGHLCGCVRCLQSLHGAPGALCPPNLGMSTVGFLIISSRIGDRNCLRIGGVLTAGLLSIYGFGSNKFWQLVTLHGCTGLGIGMIVPALGPTLARYNNLAHQANISQAAAVPMFGMQLGQIVGPLLFGLIVGEDKDRARMNLAWLVAGISFFMGVVFADISFSMIQRHPATKRLEMSSEQLKLMLETNAMEQDEFVEETCRLVRGMLTPGSPEFRGLKLWSGVAQRFVTRVISNSIPKLREDPEEHLEDVADWVVRVGNEQDLEYLLGRFPQLRKRLRPVEQEEYITGDQLIARQPSTSTATSRKSPEEEASTS